MFRKMPYILVASIVVIMLINPFIPLVVKQFLYAISLSIKSLIIFVLPFIIFSLLFKAAITLAHSAVRIIGMILALVCCSNFISTFLSHYVGIWIYHFDLSMIVPEGVAGLEPLWTVSLPTVIANDKAMFAGILGGIIASRRYINGATKSAALLDVWVNWLLRFITYLIPLFVIGFVVKLQYDGVMSIIIKDYAAIFAVIAMAQFSYIGLMYFILSNARASAFLQSIQNMIPAAISAFSTMSSAASMPLTIIGAESNTKNTEIARSVIPATVNIHLVGDCFAIPIFAYAVLKTFGMPEPSLISYIIFTCYFVLAKFSVAAVPGGGILVMLPILEAYLGFNADMMSFITALYILFDPVITCANVLGNGAFAMMIDRIVARQNAESSVE